ncbi:MAG: hypothetical protein WC479_07470 [Candidatus Izemoplasmatales bacterium]
MDELNSKLAEWAGFTKQKHPDGNWMMIYTPRGEFFSNDAYPDFRNSLDVCFKWRC